MTLVCCSACVKVPVDVSTRYGLTVSLQVASYIQLLKTAMCQCAVFTFKHKEESTSVICFPLMFAFLTPPRRRLYLSVHATFGVGTFTKHMLSHLLLHSQEKHTKNILHNFCS